MKTSVGTAFSFGVLPASVREPGGLLKHAVVSGTAAEVAGVSASVAAVSGAALVAAAVSGAAAVAAAVSGAAAVAAAVSGAAAVAAAVSGAASSKVFDHLGQGGVSRGWGCLSRETSVTTRRRNWRRPSWRVVWGWLETVAKGEGLADLEIWQPLRVGAVHRYNTAC